MTSRVLHRPSDFADAHELLPSRFAHLFEIVALVTILAGDAVAFQMIVARAMSESPTVVTWTLIVALSAAATVSMHLAGTSARRRRAGVDEAGRTWWCLLVGFWLFLGGTATYFRVVEARAATQPASADSIFGTATTTASPTAVPLALLMLGLYLVGGSTAYGIGYSMHNPARSALFRARREYRRALRHHRQVSMRRQRALARMANPVSGMLSLRALRLVTPSVEPTRTTRTSRPPVPSDAVRVDEESSPASVETDGHAGSDHPASADQHDDGLHGADQPALYAVGGSASEVDDAATVEDDSDFILDELAKRRELVLQRARAQADQLREHACHRLAVAFAEPARSSGVFDGQPRPTFSTPMTTGAKP